MHNQSYQPIVVRSLLLQESGTYNPMHARPYVTYVDGMILDDVTTRVEQSGHNTINGITMSGLAASLAAPQSAPGSLINIPFGWTERRIRFVLEVQVTNKTGGVMLYYFQGYTNYSGITTGGTIDPEMTFILNSFIGVNRVNMYTSVGMQSKDVVSESAQIINGDIQYNYQNNDNFMYRPKDIFAGMQSSYLSQAYKYQGNNNDELMDTRLRAPHYEATRSNRSNNIPTRYVANVINNYVTAAKTNAFGQHNSDILDNAITLAGETSLHENMFIRAMANIKGLGNGTNFTYNDLCKLDPNTANITNYLSLGVVEQQRVHSTGQTAYWTSADRETVVATILTNAVPAIMMELMLSKMHFRSTNCDTTGITSTVIVEGRSLTTADLSSNYEIFKLRLDKEILFDLTYGNQEIFTLDMSVDLYGETHIMLSLGSNPVIHFACPSFCDALLTPVSSGTEVGFFNVVSDFDTILNNIGQIPTESNIIAYSGQFA